LRIPLEIPFFKPGEKSITVKSTGYLAGPLHLVPAMLFSGIIDFSSLLGLRKFFRLSRKDVSGMTALDLLHFLDQSPKAIEDFWEPLITATLNTTLIEAAAVNFWAVMRQGLMANSRAAQILFPKRPYNELFDLPARDYFSKNGIVLNLNERIKQVYKSASGIMVETNKRTAEFDYVISALPVAGVNKLWPQNELQISSNPITSTYFKIKGNGIPQYPISVLLESPLQWLFKLPFNDIFTTSASVTDVSFTAEMVQKELKRFFPGTWRITQYKRITVKRATPVFSLESNKLRNFELPDKRIFMAGDWTATDLPATIEGAVLSGKTAAKRLGIYINGK